jgi:hypothetical protein
VRHTIDVIMTDQLLAQEKVTTVIVHQHPNKALVTMVAVAEKRRPHTRKKT